MPRSPGNSPEQLRQYTFFVERPLGKKVGTVLREHGLNVVLHLERFRDDADDEEWIARAAAEGWVAITGDGRVRWNPRQKLAIRVSGLRCFSLTGNHWTGPEKAQAITSALGRIAAILSSKPGPFVARINKAGEISSVYEFPPEAAATGQEEV